MQVMSCASMQEYGEKPHRALSFNDTVLDAQYHITSYNNVLVGTPTIGVENNASRLGPRDQSHVKHKTG